MDSSHNPYAFDYKKYKTKKLNRLKSEKWHRSLIVTQTLLKRCENCLESQDPEFPLYNSVPDGRIRYDKNRQCYKLQQGVDALLLDKTFPMDFFVLLIDEYILTSLISDSK